MAVAVLGRYVGGCSSTGQTARHQAVTGFYPSWHLRQKAQRNLQIEKVQYQKLFAKAKVETILGGEHGDRDGLSSTLLGIRHRCWGRNQKKIPSRIIKINSLLQQGVYDDLWSHFLQARAFCISEGSRYMDIGPRQVYQDQYVPRIWAACTDVARQSLSCLHPVWRWRFQLPTRKDVILRQKLDFPPVPD